jgi:site-specific DNA-cytosine methylase
MNLHPVAETMPIPVRKIIPRSLGTRSQRINPWMTADGPAATICRSAEGYELREAELKEAEIKPTWQAYRRLTGQEPSRHFGLVRVDPDRPAPTIQANGVTGTTTGMVHPWETRRLTISEIRLLASFPEGFKLIGTYREKWARVGNSVPPLFMRAIALHIRRVVLKRETHESLGTVCPPDREEERRKAC